MKIEKKLLPKSVVELVVEMDVKAVAKHRIKALNYIEKNADIKWFRKWAKIPEAVLEKNYSDEISRLTIDYAIDTMYRESLKKEKIMPVAQAEIKEIISESPLKIKIHIEVFPEIEIDKNYKKISLKKSKISVSAAEVNNSLEEIEKKFTKFEDVWKTAKSKIWDRLTIDTDWFEWDKLLESTSMRDYPLVLWSWVLVPWFEEWLVWVKSWDELELDITFPKDYHNKDFASKKTKFKVIVKKLERATKPDFTPEFIKQLRWKDLDLKWFKELIKSELLETKEMNSRLEEESKLIDELLKVTKMDIPESMIKNQIEKVYAEIKENMTQSWVKVADYLESLKMSEEEYKEKNVKPLAEKRLNGELILHKLNEIEKVEVTDKELEKEVETILSRFESEDVLKRLKELYVPWNKYYEELRQRTAYRKLIDSFFVEDNK